MKQTFNSVDYVGNDRFVFNIKGNDYRLVAIVLFAAKRFLFVLLALIKSMIIKTVPRLNTAYS